MGAAHCNTASISREISADAEAAHSNQSQFNGSCFPKDKLYKIEKKNVGVGRAGGDGGRQWHRLLCPSPFTTVAFLAKCENVAKFA